MYLNVCVAQLQHDKGTRVFR